MLFSVVVVFGFLFVSRYSDAQLYEGDSCTLNQSGKRGICKVLGKCPTVREDLKKGIYPTTCGFYGPEPTVCCLENPVAVTQRRPGEIADKMCRNYSQYVWTVELNPTLLIGAEDIKRRECPFDKQTLVVGGDPASRKEFPHMAQLGYQEKPIRWGCGGTLISDQYILTAAHCLEDRSLGEVLHARMGLVDLDDPDHVQQFRIVKRIAHPQYVPPAHYHDIGLVQLDSKPTLNSYVRPACLHTSSAPLTSNVIATGWGNTEFEGYESTVLLRVVLELYNRSQCNAVYKREIATGRLKNGITSELMICAGHSKELKDTCQGDSGGPLQLYRKSSSADESCMYDVIGVTSFGKACGLGVNIPGVYTRVSNYVKWIEDQVWSATS